MEKKEFISKIHELISIDLSIDGVEILYKSKEYFCAEFVSAHFNPLSYRIYINEDWLIRADAIEIIRVVAHEMRHAYQKICLDFPKLMDCQLSKEVLDLWNHEFENYYNPVINTNAYVYQSIELDANDYSKSILDYLTVKNQKH